MSRHGASGLMALSICSVTNARADHFDDIASSPMAMLRIGALHPLTRRPGQRFLVLREISQQNTQAA